MFSDFIHYLINKYHYNPYTRKFKHRKTFLAYDVNQIYEIYEKERGNITETQSADADTFQIVRKRQSAGGES